MKNREERPTASDRGASQQTFDFGDKVEPMLPANLLRQELTDPASIDTPSLSVLPDADLMEQVVDPRNLDRAWRQVKSNRGAPGPDGMTITVAPKKLKTFKRRVKELTGRSRGISMERRLTDLNRYVRGWIGYFGLAQQFDEFVNLDGCPVRF